MPRVLVLAACALLLAGCVWSRLLDFKNQLREFDRYFTAADAGPALELTCLEPCTRPEDFGYLLGGEQPTSRSAPAADGSVLWTYHLRRDRPDSIGLDVTVGTRDGLTTVLRIPPEVLRFLPHDRFLALARAMGKADIDQGRRQASTALAGADARPIAPGRDTVLRALGQPDSTTPVEQGEELVYDFKLQAADGSLGAMSELKLTMAGERLTAIRLQTPRFNAWLKLDQQQP